MIIWGYEGKEEWKGKGFVFFKSMYLLEDKYKFKRQFSFSIINRPVVIG